MYSTSLIEQCCKVYVTNIEMLNSFGHLLRYCKTKLFSTILNDIHTFNKLYYKWRWIPSRPYIWSELLRHLSGEWVSVWIKVFCLKKQCDNRQELKSENPTTLPTSSPLKWKTKGLFSWHCFIVITVCCFCNQTQGTPLCDEKFAKESSLAKTSGRHLRSSWVLR